jgi:hypothetical protein
MLLYTIYVTHLKNINNLKLMELIMVMGFALVCA